MDKEVDKEEVHKAIKRYQIEDNLKQDFVATLNDRVTRYLELDFIKITPNTHFASVSAECILLYRDGYYLACIALSQAIAEALVRFMCDRSQFGASISKDFEENVEKLRERRIQPDCSEMLMEIWKGRHDYHHLKSNVTADRAKLQEIAKSKIILLHKVESAVFAFTVVDGTVKPKYPKYWDIKNGLANVFLRFEP
jgi:hypothetical protein